MCKIILVHSILVNSTLIIASVKTNLQSEESTKFEFRGWSIINLQNNEINRTIHWIKLKAKI